MKIATSRSMVLAIAVSLVGMACSRPTETGTVQEAAAAMETVDDAEVGARFVDAMQQHGISGAQLAHVRDGVLREYVHGVVGDAGSAKVDARTTFEAASLSKVVGAYIALRLVDQGLIDLDTPLREYWRSPRIGDADPASAITARMVLNHTTGLPNWQISPSDPAIDDTHLESLFAPGERFAYSGEGFYLLQKTLEHVSGLSWNALAEREVFAPLGMPDSSFLTRSAPTADNAYGHDRDGSTRKARVFGWENTAWTLVTNADDYSRFVQRALFAGEGLAPATHAMMLAQSSDADDRALPTPADPFIAWGLGVGLQQTEARKLVWHWGDNPGFKALFVLDPQSGESLVLFTNSENGLSTYREMLQLFLGEGAYPLVEWARTQS